MSIVSLAAAVVLGSSVALVSAGQDKPKPQPSEPFEWSASRRLAWNDYLGRPDTMSQASALTVYLLGVEHGCSGGVFSFRVAVMFQPQRSWTKSATPRLLDHEQGHFDLGEVQARRLRRALGSLKEACDLPAAELNDLTSKHVIEDSERQQRYDQETIYGLNGGRQGLWEADIRTQLKDLAAFVHGGRG